jgi:hypothetical protein
MPRRWRTCSLVQASGSGRDVRPPRLVLC